MEIKRPIALLITLGIVGCGVPDEFILKLTLLPDRLLNASNALTDLDVALDAPFLVCFEQAHGIGPKKLSVISCQSE